MWSDLGVELTPALYRLLGDQARLRLLRVLARERLNVTELTAVLGVAQSGVSRHLGLLKEAGLVAEERAGGFAYYRVAPRDGSEAADALWNLLDAHFAIIAAGPTGREDEARLQEVLRLRQENFEEHSGGEGRQLVPGRSWAAWARALGLLMPPLTVADLGCGEGYLTIEVARWARRVIAVDRSEAVLQSARELAARHGMKNITWKRGEIEALPLPDARVDLALLSQALHHASDPAVALAEASRVLVPGGRALVLDLRRHEQHWVRDRLDDRWLGFEDRALGAAMRKAGFTDVRQQVGARRKGDPFTVIVACGTKPGAATAARHRR